MGVSDKKKEWSDDTLISIILNYILEYIRGLDKLPEDDKKKILQWTSIFEQNFYITLSHLKDINAEEWVALKIPLRLRTVGRQIIWNLDDDTLSDNSNNNSKKKNRKHISSEAVRKVSKSSSNLKEFKNRRITKRASIAGLTKQSSESDLNDDESESENSYIKVKRLNTTESQTTNSNKGNTNKKKLVRTKSVKLKAFRDLTNSRGETSSKDDKEILPDINGTVIIGGLNEYVERTLHQLSNSIETQDNSVSKKTINVCNECVLVDFKNANNLSTIQPGIILGVFSIIDPRSLNNIMLQYVPLAKKDNSLEHIIYLVGLDANKRNLNDRKHISHDQAIQTLKTLKGLDYLEISSEKDIQNLSFLIGKTVLRSEKTKINKNSNWLSKLPSIQRAAELKDKLENLTLKRCKLEYMPPQILQLRSTLTKLKLPRNLLKFFPEEIMYLEELIELDLSDNLIGDFPPSIIEHKRLNKVNLENNKILFVSFTMEDALFIKNNNWEIKLKGNHAYTSYQKLRKLALNQLEGNLTSSSIDQVEHISREIPIFGTSLESLMEYEKTVYPTKNTIIPEFVRESINYILSSPLEQQGLFRLEGSSSMIQEYKDQFNLKLNTKYQKIEDINSVCGLLKLWLRTLPSPILGSTEELVKIMNSSKKRRKFKEHLSKLPSINYIILSQIFRLLYILTKNSEVHKMDAQNLSTVMATNLTWSSESKTPSLEMLDQIQQAQSATTYLIENYPLFFQYKDPFKCTALSENIDPKAVFHTKLVGKHKAITCVCIGHSIKDKGAIRIWTADEKGMIHIWDAVNFKFIKQIEVGSRVNTITVSNDTVWIGTIETIQIHNLLDGEMIKKIVKPGYCFTHAGDNILSCLYSNNEGLIICFDKTTYEIVKEVKVTTRILSMIATESQVWAACQDKYIRIWDLTSFELIKEFDSIHNDKINQLCFVPKDNDLSEVWSSSDDNAVHIWNSKTMELEERLLSFHNSKITGACTMGNQVWTYTWDGCVYMWDKETRNFLGNIYSYHNQPISAITTDWIEGQEKDIWHAISVSYDHTAVVWKCRK